MILVTGATGKVGRQLVRQLSERGAAVRAVSRDPASAGLPAGVEVVRGDMADPASLKPHMAGVDAVFLVWPFTSPGLAADVGAEVVRVLARQSAPFVYLSAQAAERRPVSFWAVIEQLIEDSGAAWTFLRPTGFAANTLMWADQIRDHGVVRWPYGAAARSLIHEHDIAAVAGRALTGDGHARQRYLLTGPEVLTQADQVAVIGEVTGRAVRWEELEPEEARRQLLAAWGDPGFVDSALRTWAGLVTEPEPVTSTVEEITGVRARTFRQWAADHVSDFRPAAAAGAGAKR
ncbi:MAG TPA: NmrA family NAD(P)-binding protein [Streptosporangiaceae bacterium]